MLLRQVQAGPVQGHHLRALRRRGHPGQGAPGADGPHRAGRAGHPHLVLQGCPEPAGLPARPGSQGPREDHLLRGVPDHLGRHRGAPPRPVHRRGRDVGREEAGRGQARRRRRGAAEEARGRPRRAGGRGRQVRRAPQGARGRRAGDAPDPRPRAARDRPAGRGARHLPQARAEDADRRRDAVPRAARPVRRVLQRRHGRRGAADGCWRTSTSTPRRSRCGRPSGPARARRSCGRSSGSRSSRRSSPPATRRWAWCSTACR